MILEHLLRASVSLARSQPVTRVAVAMTSSLLGSVCRPLAPAGWAWAFREAQRRPGSHWGGIEWSGNQRREARQARPLLGPLHATKGPNLSPDGACNRSCPGRAQQVRWGPASPAFLRLCPCRLPGPRASGTRGPHGPSMAQTSLGLLREEAGPGPANSYLTEGSGSEFTRGHLPASRRVL